MSKLLKTSDKILFGLSIIGDLIDNVRTVGGVRGKAYESIYGVMPEKLKEQNYLHSWYRNIKSGNIEKIIEGTGVKFRLTSQGKNKLVRDFPLPEMQKKSWDKKLRIVTFDIPEEIRWRRDVFRQKLKELGFGMIEQSVWISPYPFESDIREFIDSQHLTGFSYVFVSDNSFFTNDITAFVDRVWGIENLNEEYKDVLESGEEDMVNKYLALIQKDPFLPRQILPKPWHYTQLHNKVVTFLSSGRNTKMA